MTTSRGDIVYIQSSDKLHELSGREIIRQRTKIGMVLQQYNSFPHLSVLESIVIASIKILKKERRYYRSGINSFKTVGLEIHTYAFSPSLSGDQQQHVAIVRALIMQPKEQVV
ncbi:amino acid ABC transporter ATP-binding protein [Acetobacter okinawensis]|nr:amino acid ABC transporter ATP-binding protein [Acetobacter okinawensis]